MVHDERYPGSWTGSSLKRFALQFQDNGAFFVSSFYGATSKCTQILKTLTSPGRMPGIWLPRRHVSYAHNSAALIGQK